MKKTINWKQGSASLIIMMSISVLAVYLLLLYMTLTNIIFSNTVAVTRTDLMADSVAVYSQSYDYKYNKSQAEIMTTLLTMYNNSTSDFYNISTSITFPSVYNNQNGKIIDVLKINSKVGTKAFYPDLLGTDVIYSFAEAQVSSIDVWKDILVVPEDIGNNRDNPNNPLNPNNADITMN